MSEVADAGEHHRDAVGIGGGDHLGVAVRAARLDRRPGGLAIANFGDYSWMWYADALLATMAALSNLPIREARIVRAPAIA